MRQTPPQPPESPSSLAPSLSEIRLRLIGSGLSSYALLIVRLAAGLVLTRILFLNLPRVEYGVWALCWSFFGYALVLDLGFGVAMAKFTSQASVQGDWEGLNRRLNTVLPLYAAMGGVIGLVTLLVAPLLGSLLRLDGSPEEIARYQDVFRVFGLGTALVFPLGVFGEMLAGLGRIPLRNTLAIAATLLNFALLWAAVDARLGLETMAAASLAVSAATNLAMGAAVRSLLPGFRLDSRLFDRRLLADTLSFSLFSYLITVGGLILLRVDQLVIGALLAVSLVAPYQVAWRLSDIFRELSVQMLEALGPLAAALFEAQERDRLQRALSDGSRLVAALATLFGLPLAVYLGPLLELWLELSDPAALRCGWILLGAAWVSAVFKAATTRVLLMCQQERSLAMATVIEALLNLGLSVALCVHTKLGIVGVALGTLVPSILLSLAAYLPLAARFSRVPVRRWLVETLSGPAAASLLAAPVFLLSLEAVRPSTVLALVASAIPGTAVLLLALGRFGLRPVERRQLLSLLPRRS